MRQTLDNLPLDKCPRSRGGDIFRNFFLKIANESNGLLFADNWTGKERKRLREKKGLEERERQSRAQ